jgi:protocatechuate 3,4-dioxygenase alpha subunit
MSRPSLGVTPAQTVGPYFALGLAERPFCAVPSDRSVLLTGCVRDGAGTPVPDALLEIWTPGHGPNGFFRVGVSADGSFEFPCWDDVPDTRAVLVQVMARGVLETLNTLVWREDCAPPPDSTRWLGIPAARRDTLLARKVGAGYAWNIRLSGGMDAGETVFLDPAD